ncbi:DUF2939 domain-containing protein [uncultured Caulobacter sp.]|uniref:DUF2939 domain-containing protein n=1 Tax=uncultured Caulobacter sp. TaxID=158749 RepID=UPI002614EFEF|nr:DUF2939 domain-containing protein [uncultured Caulobacter sp.]
MTRNNRILIGAGATVAVVLLVAGYFVSPLLALQNLNEAARAGDKARLESAVDFPAVRESLKSQLKAAMTRKFAEDPKLRDNPFAAFGQMLLVGVVDKAVETYATPDAIATMVATNKAPQSTAQAAPGPTDPAPQAPAEAPAKAKSPSDTERKLAYLDLNHFKAAYRDRRDGDTFGLVLERRGVFAWKLVRIELPGFDKA